MQRISLTYRIIISKNQNSPLTSPAMQWIDKIIKNLHPSATFKGKVDITCVENIQQVHVIGIGKASCAQVGVCVQMISAQTKVPIYGFAFTKEKHGYVSNNFSYFESAHPISNQSSIDAADKLIEILNNTTANDLLIVCLSGGASALVWKPFDCWSIEDIQQLTKELLSQNICIDQINQIRRQLCKIKNGGLAVHCKTKHIIELITSDVDSGDLSTVGSGPLHFITPNSKLGDIKNTDVIKKFIEFSRSPEKQQWDNQITQTLKQKHIQVIPTGTPDTLKAVAKKVLTVEGYEVIDISEQVKATSIEQGVQKHADIIKNLKIEKKSAIISVGEYSVELPSNPPPGGRNIHFALALAYKLQHPKAQVFSFGSDGTDGSTQAAGGFANLEMLKQGAQQGLSAEQALSSHNSYAFLKSLNGLIQTGPTQTNLLDLRVIFIDS